MMCMHNYIYISLYTSDVRTNTNIILILVLISQVSVSVYYVSKHTFDQWSSSSPILSVSKSTLTRMLLRKLRIKILD